MKLEMAVFLVNIFFMKGILKWKLPVGKYEAGA